MPRVFSPEQLAKGIKGFGDKALEDLAGREQDIQRGKTVELLRRAGKEMYENPIINTTLSALPVSGELMAAGDIGDELSAGNYGTAGLYTILATLPGGSKGIKALKGLRAIPEGPQAQALREAELYGQKILGLPPGNTPMDRAVAGGYIDPSYHGTKKDIENFDLSYHGTATDPGDFGEALYSSANPNIAGNYAESTMRGATNEGANIMPLMVRRGEQMQVEGMKGMEPLLEKAGGLENWFDLSPKEQAKIAQDMGFTSVRDFGYPQTANYNLSDVRSKFAAFDPRYFGKPGLMLGAGGLGVYGALQGEDEYK